MRDLLGYKVKDIVTGFAGVAITEIRSIGESTRYYVEPSVGDDNELRSGETFPEARLMLLEDVKTLDDKLDEIAGKGVSKYPM